MDSVWLDPIHPAEFVREDWMAETGMRVEAVAAALRLSVSETERFLREEQGVTPDLAARLSDGLGCSVEFWLGLQRSYEDDLSRRAGRLERARVGPVAAE